MPEPNMASKMAEKADLVKMLKHAKEQALKEWDVSFGINGEILTNILSFISDINTEVPIKFYSDKAIIQLLSPDKIQYAEIEINSTDVLDYSPNIEGDPSRRDAKIIVKGTEGDYKGVLVDVKGTIDELAPFVQKDEIVVVRVDTSYHKKVEFHCPGNVVIWAQLLDPTSAMKSVEKMPEVIKRVRNNPDIKKASVIIEPATFTKICSIGGKGGKKRDIDERIFIQLDKENGLFVTSGDRLKGRYFELKPMEIGMGGQQGDTFEDMGTGYGTSGTGYGTGGMGYGTGEMGHNPMEMEDELGGSDEYGYAPSEVIENKEEKKKTGAPQDQLLGIDVDSTQYIYMGKEFIMPFTKLKGLSPIIMEIRTGKPIFIEQKPFNSIKVVLTVAPRMENQEDV